MADFFFRAVDTKGEVETGRLEARDIASVAVLLRRRGLQPLEIVAGKKTLAMRLNEPVTLFQKPGDEEVATFLRDLARLLRAGLSIDDAFKLLFDMQDNELFLKVLQNMRETLRRGEGLATAMTEHKDLFPIQVIASIQAGELSGALPDALDAISSGMEKALSFKRRLKSALIYPTILLMMVVATFILVMTFVLPQFAPLFEGNEDKLPAITRLVMGTAKAFGEYLWFIIGFVVLLIASAFWVAGDARAKASFLERVCAVPSVGRWLTAPDIIRFVRTLGVCCRSGIALDKAIVMATEAVKLPHLVEALTQVRAQVRRGSMLTEGLSESGLFPALVLQFARVGEQSGNLGVMLEEAATLLVQEYEARLEKALSILSPVLTLVMGGIVALLVGSVLLGIMSINDVAL